METGYEAGPSVFLSERKFTPLDPGNGVEPMLGLKTKLPPEGARPWMSSTSFLLSRLRPTACKSAEVGADRFSNSRLLAFLKSSRVYSAADRIPRCDFPLRCSTAC